MCYSKNMMVRMADGTDKPIGEVYPGDMVKAYNCVHNSEDEEIVSIDKNGYDILEDGHGIIGFAAPLFQKGHVVGCVGTYLPVIRMTDKNYILDELLQCVKEINQKLVLQ